MFQLISYQNQARDPAEPIALIARFIELSFLGITLFSWRQPHSFSPKRAAGKALSAFSYRLFLAQTLDYHCGSGSLHYFSIDFNYNGTVLECSAGEDENMKRLVVSGALPTRYKTSPY